MVTASVNRMEAAPLLPEGRLLVLGGGYTGQRFGNTLAERGLAVTLTRRDPPPGNGENQEGPRWIRFDPASGVVPPAEDLAGTTHVLVTIPPDRSGADPVLTHLGGLPLHHRRLRRSRRGLGG